MDSVRTQNKRKSLLLIVAFTLYAFAAVFSKIAASKVMFSGEFTLFLFGALVLMATYALIWQKILSIMSLAKAYLLKSLTIIMILCISAVVFSEIISFCNVVGTILIVSGVCVLAWKR